MVNRDDKKLLGGIQMNTKIFEQFDVMTDAELAKVEGGGMEWIGDVLGAIGNAAHPVNPRSSGRPIKWKVSTSWSCSFLPSWRNWRNTQCLQLVGNDIYLSVKTYKLKII